MPINPNCYVIGVLGGKGGVGKSVFSANLAFAAMMEMRAQVLLMDMDANSGGDQDIIIGQRAIKTIGEISTFTGSVNPQTLPTLATRHPTGLMYIGAVRSPAETLSANPENVVRQIENLSKLFNFIVIDLGSHMGPLQKAVAELCTVHLVVTIPEILAVNQTMRLIQELSVMAFPADMCQIVVNKASQMGLAPQNIGASLRRNVVGVIPQDDATVNSSIQRQTPFVPSSPGAAISMAYHDVVRRLSGGILQKLSQLQKPKTSLQTSVNAQVGATLPGNTASSKKALDPRNLLKIKIHGELIMSRDLKKEISETKGDPEKEKALRAKTQSKISEVLDREVQGLQRDERSKLIKEVLDEALGLGPLEELLADNTVTEIMVNGCDKIYIEKSGKLTLSTTTFTSNLQLRNVIERIVSPLGRQINDSSPYVDARLKDGSRVHAIVEPLAIDGPALTIRKFAKDAITPDHYINWGTANKQMMDFLRVCVEQALNIIISGGTGSGKTTLLNVLSSFIPKSDRIITVEDAAELQLKQDHVVRLETRPANMEGNGSVSIRDLVRNTLRMRPNRIIVGECRDGAALDMLQAMNTGHDGSMTTVHANSPLEAIARLETLCLMAGMELPTKAIRDQIAGAVNLIVQIKRLSDGSRKITSITEVQGMQGDVITLAEIFRFKQTQFDKNRKIIGQFQARGNIPKFVEILSAKGVELPRDLFMNPENGGAPNPTPSPTKKTGS